MLVIRKSITRHRRWLHSTFKFLYFHAFQYFRGRRDSAGSSSPKVYIRCQRHKIGELRLEVREASDYILRATGFAIIQAFLGRISIDVTVTRNNALQRHAW